MAPALKLIYRFDEPVLPPGIMALYSAINPPMWWSPSFGHDTDVTVMTAFITGDWARELHAEGEEARARTRFPHAARPSWGAGCRTRKPP